MGKWGACMELKKLPYELTVCKVGSFADIDFDRDFFFVGKTDEELSLVCETSDVPIRTLAREDGWRAFRIEGVLADSGIGIFAVSTYNTDYILVKDENFDRAVEALVAVGYVVG